jgi:hypothetical protein
MTEAERIAQQIALALPTLLGGSLQFWGDWFGRPHDNVHQIVHCWADHDVLKLTFDEDEVLSIWHPRGCLADGRTFRVESADRVRWEWFYYGRPKTSANLLFMDYVRTPEGITATSNVDWYTPEFRTSLTHPAVQMT